MNIRTFPVPLCPECGKKMVLRQPKGIETWEAFWGCSQFPKCTGSLNIRSNGTPDTEDEEEWDPYEDEDFEEGDMV